MKHTRKKVQGGSNSPRTKLKQLWRMMPEEERERWRDIFVSNVPSAEIREKMKAELNIGLTDDAQLCRFRDWEEKERQQEELEDGVNEDYQYWEERFGTEEAMEKARKKLLACSYARALRYGNYQDGLRTLRGDCRVQRMDLAAQSTAHLIREGEARALEMCLEDAKKYPEVVEQFRQVFAALEQARNES